MSLYRPLPTPTDVGEYPKFDVTTHKALLGQRLLVALCVVSCVSFLGAQLSGDRDMAKFIYETFLTFFAIGVLGVNAGQYGLQRFSSKEREEAKERGRESARLNAPPPTREHQAQTNIEQADQVIVPTQPAPVPPTTVMGGVVQRARPTGDARVDDERGYEAAP